MKAPYSLTRLRHFVEDRDNARAALDAASARQKSAKESHRAATMSLNEFYASNIAINSDLNAQAHDRHKNRLEAIEKDAREVLERYTHERNVAAQKMSISASICVNCIKFAKTLGKLPHDIEELAR